MGQLSQVLLQLVKFLLILVRPADSLDLLPVELPAGTRLARAIILLQEPLEVSAGADQLFEGRVLVRPRAEKRLSHPGIGRRSHRERGVVQCGDRGGDRLDSFGKLGRRGGELSSNWPAA